MTSQSIEELDWNEWENQRGEGGVDTGREERWIEDYQDLDGRSNFEPLEQTRASGAPMVPTHLLCISNLSRRFKGKRKHVVCIFLCGRNKGYSSSSGVEFETFHCSSCRCSVL